MDMRQGVRDLLRTGYDASGLPIRLHSTEEAREYLMSVGYGIGDALNGSGYWVESPRHTTEKLTDVDLIDLANTVKRNKEK